MQEVLQTVTYDLWHGQEDSPTTQAIIFTVARRGRDYERGGGDSAVLPCDFEHGRVKVCETGVTEDKFPSLKLLLRYSEWSGGRTFQTSEEIEEERYVGLGLHHPVHRVQREGDQL